MRYQVVSNFRREPNQKFGKRGRSPAIRAARGSAGDSPRAIHSIEYKTHIQSAEWAEIRRAALKRAGYRCALCGLHKTRLRMLGRHLEAHHNTYANLGHERPEDITILCAGIGGCHALADAQRRAANRTRPAKRLNRRGRKRRLPKPLRDLRRAVLGLGSVIVLLKLAAVTLPT